ncbi:hypothetical protein M0Q50_05965 [bacterium]|jgi:hypothetical protein|nr:hypothetical protein [bacterium]
MIRIYIASPYTNGNQVENTNLQLDIAYELLYRGYAPYFPLSSHYVQIRYPQFNYNWLDLDFQYLQCCDILIRIKPIINNEELLSPGADAEEKEAKRLNIPVFTFNTIEEMCKFLDENAFTSELNILEK